MCAAVFECIELAIRVARDYDWSNANERAAEVARIRHLGLEAQIAPVRTTKDCFLLVRVDLVALEQHVGYARDALGRPLEESVKEKLKAREFWTGGGPSQPVKITGSVTAIDVTSGKIAGKFETPFPNLGGILATPDLVFSGQPSGEVMALDGKTLQKLWEFNTGGGVNAPPMTFSVDGKQYVAILVGLGGAWDKWFIDATPELKRMQPGSVLYVFAL